MPYDTGWGQFVNSLTNPPNPLQQFGGTIELANKLKQFQADKAIADIYGQSIDPTTGQVDLGKFNALAQGQPNALWHFGESMKSAGSGLQAQGVGTSAQLQAAQDQLGAQAGYLTGLIPKAQNGTLTADDIRSALNDMPPGLMSPTTVANINRQLDSGANPVNVFWGGMFANNHAREVLSSALGPIATVQQGGQTSFVRQPPTAPGGVSPPLPIGMTPEQWGHLVPWYDETTGKTVQRPLGEILGIPKPMGVDAGPGSTTPVPQPSGGGRGGAPGPQSSAMPPTTPGSSAGGENVEVATNNFAGMRNPNVPAAGGPRTNPAGWQRFDTPEQGIQAISHQLDRYASGATTGTSLTTLNGIISTWAPPSENDTPALIARASKVMGVKPDEPLDLSNPDTKAKLVEAMIRNEQGGILPQKAANAIPGALGAPNWKPYGTTQTASDTTPPPPTGGSTRPGGAQVASTGPNAIPQPPGPGQPTNINQPTPPVGASATTLPPVSVSAPAPSPALPVQVAQAGGGHDVPGQNPFLQPQFGKGAEDYTSSMETDKTLGTRTKPLINAIQLLRNNPQLPVGPAAKDWTAWQTALRDVFGVDISTSGATTYQELAKQLAQNAVVQNMASPTDLARLNTAAAQPNPEQSREAIETLAAEQIGLERIKSAQFRYFRSLHPGKFPAANSPEQNAQYFNMETGDWAADQDPMAYALDFAPQKAITDYLDGLEKNAPDQVRKFGDSVNNARTLLKMKVPTAPVQGQ